MKIVSIIFLAAILFVFQIGGCQDQQQVKLHDLHIGGKLVTFTYQGDRLVYEYCDAGLDYNYQEEIFTRGEYKGKIIPWSFYSLTDNGYRIDKQLVADWKAVVMEAGYGRGIIYADCEGAYFQVCGLLLHPDRYVATVPEAPARNRYSGSPSMIHPFGNIDTTR